MPINPVLTELRWSSECFEDDDNAETFDRLMKASVAMQEFFSGAFGLGRIIRIVMPESGVYIVREGDFLGWVNTTWARFIEDGAYRGVNVARAEKVSSVAAVVAEGGDKDDS